MSDLWAVLLAVSAWVGASAAAPLPLLGAAGIATVGLALRRPAALCLGVALATSALAARSHNGLDPPAVGAWAGVATLVDDPGDVSGALRVTVRIGGKRVEAWARGSSAGALHARLAGEKVWLAGRLSDLPSSLRARLAPRHIAGRLTVEKVGAWAPGSLPSRVANGVRRTVLAGAESLSPERRALFGGFVLGDDRGQSVEVADDFRASGLTHLLVVSGQNVAFVLALAGPGLRRTGLRTRFALGLAVLVFFGLLTRWEPSVLRAVSMAAIALLADTLGRPMSGVRVLALAVTGLLLVDPLVASSVGFRLSVGACAGIAVLAAPLSRALPGPRPLASALGVTLAAQVGVAPVLVPTFGTLPVVAIPANLLALPAAGPLSVWAMAAGLPAGVAGGAVARAVHVPTDLLLGWVAGVARVAATAPLGQLRAPHLLGLVAAVVVGVGLRRRALAAVAVVGVLVVASVPVARPGALDGRPVSPGARVWRVGGATLMVVDGARSPAALLSGLRAAAVRRLDAVVVARPGRRAAGVVEPTLHRYGPPLVLAPPGSPLPRATVPEEGTLVHLGSLTLRVVRAGPRRLDVEVNAGPSPPHR
ncbi:MAG TPA: ComEC/Rec2 family competence protein [Acidimicrobiales bacterium]|nr:ComEC/Rec2 family competence protein [Acidimicrobiales bacterium]